MKKTVKITIILSILSITAIFCLNIKKITLSRIEASIKTKIQSVNSDLSYEKIALDWRSVTLSNVKMSKPKALTADEVKISFCISKEKLFELCDINFKTQS